MKRRKMKRRTAAKQFKRGANKTHGKNLPRSVLRGGYRL